MYPMTNPELLVFTDLDGSLLDHDTYSWAPAKPALSRLQHAGIPVIAVSSKTLAELDALRASLPLSETRVAENGAVIAYGDQPPQITPPDYDSLRATLADLASQPGMAFSGFADMNTAQVMAATGLAADDASRAKQRLASEPLLWLGSEEALDDFKQAITKAGLHWLRGGRFLHVLGNTDKGRAVKKIRDAYQQGTDGRIRTIGLGDGDNDKDMLLAVDQPVVIRRHDGSHLQLAERPDALLTDQPGPTGWNQAIQHILDDLGVANDG